MSIVLDDQDYILGVWSANGPTHNILILVLRKSDARWHFHVRVREYLDDKIWEESKDVKSFHEWTMGPDVTEEIMIQSASDIIRMSSEFYEAWDVHYALVQSTDKDVFNRIIQSLPGFHTQIRTVH